MKKIFITAAPVGAMPKKIYAHEPMFLSSNDLTKLSQKYQKLDIQNILLCDDWEEVDRGGLMITHQRKGHSPTTFPIDYLQYLPASVAKRAIMILTTQGWSMSEDGVLYWPHPTGVSYMPPDIVKEMTESSFIESLKKDEWKFAPAGLWHRGRMGSAALPVSPECIIREAVLCYQRGAAIVHLHTRRLKTMFSLKFGNSMEIRGETQENHIDLSQYEVIVPAIFKSRARPLLNISTSTRGSNADFRSPTRRAPLKRFAPSNTSPEIASLSPGPVTFANGGGYQNPHDFIVSQIEHFIHYGIRPEIELFNLTILDNALGPYSTMIKSCGEPVLFMLVACVDQIDTSIESCQCDISLIPSDIRTQALNHINSEQDDRHALATALIVHALRPTVEKIRSRFSQSLISILLPGPLQTLVVDVALNLDLDGVRVGLEDSLTILDSRVPGGVRKASGTFEQVTWAAHEIKDKGASVLSAEELRPRIRPVADHIET